MATFSELLRSHVERTGISDTELARSVGVRRQTIFRWKEGIVARPRHREDVLLCARKLRLTAQERDELLMAAGFPPEDPPASADQATAASSSALEPSSAEPAADSVGTPEPVEDPAAAPRTDAPDDPAAEVRAIPTAVWFLVGAFFLVIIGLAMGWIRPGTPPVAAPTPAPTPSIGAVDGETLVLIAEFANYAPDSGFNVAGRIREAVDAEIAAAGLSDVRVDIWPHALTDPDQAADLIVDTDAAVLIWGEYDSGRVRANIATPDESRRWERLLPSPDELSLTINENVPTQVRALAILSLGRLYRADGRLDDARAVFRRALEDDLLPDVDDPEFASTVRFYLATVLEDGTAAERDEAIGLYSAVIDAQPQWVNARYNRGTAYLARYYGLGGAKSDLDRAIDDLSWVISRRRDFADAYLNRGIAYYEREEIGDATRAVDHLTRAIDLDPDNARYYFNRGLVYIQTGDDDAWPADFAQALAIDPEYAPAYNGLCWGHALAGQPDDALPNCDRALELGQGALARDGRGIANAVAGDHAAAVEDLTAYLTWVESLPAEYYERYRGPEVTDWIAALEAGENPFDEEALAGLR